MLWKEVNDPLIKISCIVEQEKTLLWFLTMVKALKKKS